jgi:hypothetical protein
MISKSYLVQNYYIFHIVYNKKYLDFYTKYDFEIINHIYYSILIIRKYTISIIFLLKPSDCCIFNDVDSLKMLDFPYFLRVFPVQKYLNSGNS